MEFESPDKSGYHLGHEESIPAALSGLLMLLLLILLGSILGLLMIYGLGEVLGFDFQELMQNIAIENNVDKRNLVRSTLIINHLTMFVIPGLLFTYLFYKGDWAQYLHLRSQPLLKNIVLGILLMLLAIPFVQFSYWLNQQLPLPEWALAMEDSTATLIENLLLVEAPYELLFNILVIAVIPALGEEIIFRGIIQQKLQAAFKHPHLAIWITAFLFSAFHMQFEGFIPRMVLGALLGYLFYWTNNLWIPILAHFINNAAQIILQFLYAKEISNLDLDQADQVPWSIGLFSLIFVLVLANYIRTINKTPIESS